MSTPPSSRKPSPTEQARREVEAEREQLVQAVDQLRAEIADVKARMRRKLPFSLRARSLPASSSPAAPVRPRASSLGAAAKAARRRASAASALSTATNDPAPVGHVPPGPHRLSAAEWIDVFKRAFKQFVADDCMGLAQQVAYSSLLAFFPAVVLLVGLLGLVGAYDQLQDFLNPVAPEAVTDLIEQLQNDSGGSGSVVAVVVGAFAAVWIASGAMGSVVKAVNRAYDRVETRPFWKVRLIAIVLVAASGIVTAGTLLLIVFGGTIGEAIADQAHLGSEFERIWNIVRWPLAFVAVLLLFELIYYLAPNKEQRSWKWITRAPSSAPSCGWRSRGSSPCTPRSAARTPGRTARWPAASSCCSGSTTRRGRSSSEGS